MTTMHRARRRRSTRCSSRRRPEAIWDAITKPEFTTRYFHGARIEIDARAGARRASARDGADAGATAPMLEYDPPRRLVHGWRSLYDPELRPRSTSRVTWEIEPQEGGVLASSPSTHDQLEGAPKTAESVSGAGWMIVLSGLKTLLETGDVLDPDRG